MSTNSTEALSVNFNKKVLGIDPRIPKLQKKDEFKLSVVQLKEEIQEFEDAYEDGNLVECVDAMMDLKVFADGVLYKMGLTPEDMFECAEAINTANMAKKAGVKATRVVTEGDDAPVDANKPEGWVGPEAAIALVLARRVEKCRS